MLVIVLAARAGFAVLTTFAEGCQKAVEAFLSIPGL